MEHTGRRCGPSKLDADLTKTISAARARFNLRRRGVRALSTWACLVALSLPAAPSHGKGAAPAFEYQRAAPSQLFVWLSVVEQGRDLGNKSVADRKDTPYPRDGGEYIRSKTIDAEKHSTGNQDDPYSQRDRATSARSPKLLARGRLHGRQDIPETSASTWYRSATLASRIKIESKRLCCRTCLASSLARPRRCGARRSPAERRAAA